MISPRAPGFVLIYAAAMGLSLLAGCGGGSVSGTVPVTGKVTYKGQPVEGATVAFHSNSADGRVAVATTGAGGVYELITLDSKGALPGNYSVTVKKTELPPELTRDVSMEEAAAKANEPLPMPKELLPAKYAAPGTTPLEFEVKSGSNTIDLTLED
jgi:hypothetical protein